MDAYQVNKRRKFEDSESWGIITFMQYSFSVEINLFVSIYHMSNINVNDYHYD